MDEEAMVLLIECFVVIQEDVCSDGGSQVLGTILAEGE